MFSIDDGEKLAALIIKKGIEQPLFVNTANKTPTKLLKQDNYCIFCDKFFYSKYELNRHLSNSCTSNFESIKSLKYSFTNNNTEFIIYDERITLNPTFILQKNNNLRMLVIGQSGTGKTTFAKNFIETFRKTNEEIKKFNVVLISRHYTDPSIDDLKKIYRLSLDPNEPVNIEDLKDKIVLFDDIENSTDKNIQSYAESLRNDVFQNGRKYNIHCISIIHLYDGKYLKTLINESNALVLMNQNMTYNNDRIITKYLGFSTKDNTKLKNKLSSSGNCRYIYFNLDFPRYIITSKFAWII